MLIKIKKTLNKILNIPRPAKTFIAISLDFAACVISIWASYYLRLGDLIYLSEKGIESLIIALVIALPICYIFGLYKAIFRHSGTYSLLKVTRAIFVYSIFYLTFISFIGIRGIPRSIGLIQPLILLIIMCSWRILIRFILRMIINENPENKKITKALVYGSGQSGRQLVRAMQDSPEILIKGFLDDNNDKHGFFIDGKPIYSPNKLQKIIKKKNINLILLALPSIERKERYKIIRNLSKYKIAVRSIPGIADLAKGKSFTDFVDLDIDDLLGRIQVEPYKELMKKNINGKVILVTGAGGSIGSELCRQIIKLKPEKLLLIEISEYALYSIHYELEQFKSSNIEVIPLIGSVQDVKRMKEVVSLWKPATIYHAAAYKHVPLVEYNLIEGLKNNVIGTFEMANIALNNNVSNFVFVSTDKAVRPTNTMGATKRLAELCLQALNNKIISDPRKKLNTKFSIVRFGNVLHSSGSVIPKFRDQIRKGGPLTLTNKEVTRYFMTITEAAQLVIQAGALSEGGDVFVLDMGDPIKIYDLAVKMIQLSGLTLKKSPKAQGNIEIFITGLRPGEKLYEELLLSENPVKTKHPKIFRSEEPFIDLDELLLEINSLKSLMKKNDFENIRDKLKKLVIDFSPNSGIIDHTFIKKL